MPKPARFHARRSVLGALCAGLALFTATLGAAPPVAKGMVEDQTPICNYLDRGINDFTLNWGDVDTTLRRIDHYSVIPQQLPNLESIDFLQFGLDLPVSHCKNAAHSVPCADKDLTLDWCLNEVGLSVLGHELYHATAPGCLLNVGAGLGGLRTISGAELRSNPHWGFTQDELKELYSYFNVDDLTFQIPKLEIDGAYLELLVESTIGHLLARDAKGCDNPLYCGDHGKLGAALADKADADCDFGDCDSNRMSSPWVEIKGNEDQLRVNVDLKIHSSLTDLADTQTLDGKQHYGQNWQQWSHGSLEFDLGFPCAKKHRVLVDAGDPEDPADDQWQTLPECSQDLDAMCFLPEPEGAGEGVVQCPEGEDSTLCGQVFATSQPAHELTIALGTPTFEGEGGIIPEDLITKTLQERLDSAALSGLALVKNLPTCPLVFTFFDGDVMIDFQTLQEGGIKIQHPAAQAMGKTLSQAPVIAAKDAAPSAPRRVSAEWIAEMAYDRTRLTRAGKMPMDDINEVIVQLCAAAIACQGDYAPSQTTLDQLLGVDFNDLQTALQTVCADQACWKNLVTDINQIIGFLFYDPAFAQGCVGVQSVPDPADLSNLVEHALYLSELKSWYLDKFEVAASSETCRDLDVEGFFPTLATILSLGTANHEVADGFSFVNFQEHTFVAGDTDDKLREDRCRHIENFVNAPSKAPVCGDDGRIASGPGAGEWCGSVVGGACRDIRLPAAELPGQYPEDPGYHPNGDYRWYTRCDDDSEGHAMSCTEGFFPGAGENYAGVCKRCGVPGLYDDPADFTMIGCELAPTPLDECPQGLYLQPDGRCWDIDTGVPEWECEADCAGMYNDYGWCVHHGAWRDWMSDEHLFFAQYEQTYDRPICAEHTSCPDSGVGCAAAGKACQPDSGTCAMECVSNADCIGVAPAPAYPDGFICHLATNTCRLP